jgi:hypothetical protein
MDEHEIYAALANTYESYSDVAVYDAVKRIKGGATASTVAVECIKRLVAEKQELHKRLELAQLGAQPRPIKPASPSPHQFPDELMNLTAPRRYALSDILKEDPSIPPKVSALYCGPRFYAPSNEVHPVGFFSGGEMQTLLINESEQRTTTDFFSVLMNVQMFSRMQRRIDALKTRPHLRDAGVGLAFVQVGHVCYLDDVRFEKAEVQFETEHVRAHEKLTCRASGFHTPSR